MDERKREREDRRHRRRQRVLLQRVVLVLALVLLILLAAVLIRSCGAEPEGTASSGKLTVSLVGELTLTHEFGTDFQDPGVAATWGEEPVEAEVTVELPEMTKLGEYTLRYTVTYGKKTLELERTVQVVDTTAPVLTLNHLPGHVTEPGQNYIDEGCAAFDNYDGDISDKVVAVQNGAVVTYTVTDSSGNTATIDRTIVYGDAVAPQISLLGGDTVTITAGETFQEPGFTAQDNVDGDLTAKVTVVGTYDNFLPGSYTLTYTVADSHGNIATVSRTLVVKGLTQPDVVDPGKKVIYLTFDDGPSDHTPKLLQILEKYNVKVTFFVVGNSRLEYLDDIAAGGHSIGIHTDSHVYSEIYASEDAFFKDFYAIRDKIKKYSGISTTLTRFPGGSSNVESRKFCPGIMTKLTQAVPAQGFQYFDWNVDSNDAGGAKTAEEVYANVIAGIRDSRPNIVLQHDIHAYSVDAVEKIIQWGLANGYCFLPLEPTSPNAHHPVNN